MGKRLLLALATVALLLLQSANCMAAVPMGRQEMQCCGTMPCTPSNQNQPCCKHMVSARAYYMVPAQHLPLHAPAVATVKYPSVLELLERGHDTTPGVNAQQHSPPDLYTLHACLLI